MNTVTWTQNTCAKFLCLFPYHPTGLFLSSTLWYRCFLKKWHRTKFAEFTVHTHTYIVHTHTHIFVGFQSNTNALRKLENDIQNKAKYLNYCHFITLSKFI